MIAQSFRGEVFQRDTFIDKESTFSRPLCFNSLHRHTWVCLIPNMTEFYIILTFVKQITSQVQAVLFLRFFIFGVEFHDSYGGQWLKNKPIHIEKAGKKLNKDMILTALRRENEPEL